MRQHKAVMVKEVLHFIKVRKEGVYIDATEGGGGHTKEIVSKGGRVLGIDCDLKSLEIAKRNLGEVHDRAKLVQGNFADIARIAKESGFDRVNGILFDLGVASFQLEDLSLGLSFLRDGPLDMRVDKGLGVTGSDLVNSLPEAQLRDMFWEYSQEGQGREIAREIVSSRQKNKIQTTGQLREIVERVKGKGGRINPSTKVFMALRIAVNTEFDNLEKGLLQSIDLLRGRGRLAVISFHSGEDRIVKDFFRTQEKLNLMKILTKKPVVPSDEEILGNSRARSAKLRAGEKYD